MPWDLDSTRAAEDVRSGGGELHAGSVVLPVRFEHLGRGQAHEAVEHLVSSAGVEDAPRGGGRFARLGGPPSSQQRPRD